MEYIYEKSFYHLLRKSQIISNKVSQNGTNLRDLKKYVCIHAHTYSSIDIFWVHIINIDICWPVKKYYR